MTNKIRKNLVAVRLSDEEYAHLQKCAGESGDKIRISTYIRDLIRSGNNPVHDREMVASIRKIQTDLRFCLVRIMRDCSDSVVTSLKPLFCSIEEQLRILTGKDM